MRSAQVKRLPVVDDTGVLVGIVSRGDLLKIFLRSDDAIHDEVVHDMLGQTLRLAPRDVDVAVHDGVVNLTGKLPYRSLVAITEQLCRSVDGVVAVHQTLGFTEDDTTSEQTTSAARSDGHT
jgi:CBS domain-containing protein